MNTVKHTPQISQFAGNLKEICAALREVTECTIFMHRRPDGDTVGSAAALGMALKSLGKRVQYACSDEITPRYAYLVDGAEHFDEPRGTLIAVDIAAPDMAGRFEEYVKKADIVIDHHESNPLYGGLNLVRPDAAACGEIMYEVIRELVPVEGKIAEALYVAVATDTGCFLHGSTTPDTHRVAAALMEAEGFDFRPVNRALFVVKSRASVLIRSKILETLEFYGDGALAVLTLSQKMIDECGATEDDMENISAVGMQMEGVTASATLRQTGENEYKVSLRSVGAINAATVCAKCGGGGHMMAAGCTLQGSEDDCRARIAAAMLEELE